MNTIDTKIEGSSRGSTLPNKMITIFLGLFFALALSACQPTSDDNTNNSTATVPGAPTNATATAGDAQASVSFTAPTDNGGSAITGYTVTSIPAGGVDTNAGTNGTTHTITGLTNGTSYTFTVHAINSVGNSVESVPTVSVTPAAAGATTVPDAPTGLVVTGGNSQATVVFGAPANDGGSAITGYTVTSIPAGGVDTNAGTTSLNHVITGLTNGTSYTFTAHATNAIGDGAESAASGAVTPMAAPAAPTTVPAAPTVVAPNFLSLYGTTLGNLAGSNPNPGWGQATVFSEITVAGDTIMQLSNLNFQGFEIVNGSAGSVDVSGFSNLHVDIYAPSLNPINVSLVGAGENAVAVTPTQIGWNSFDIPLNQYTVPNLTAIIQLKFEDVSVTGSTVYIDNLYFWKAPAAPGTLVTTTTADWTLTGANGATAQVVTNQPAGGTNPNAAELSDGNTGGQWFGVTFLTLTNQEFCTTANPTITVDVYAAAGVQFRLKLEDPNPGNVDNIEMDKTTAVAGWQTLTYNCLTDSGAATNPGPTMNYAEASVYNKATIFPNFTGVSAGGIWYMDKVTFTPTAATTYVAPPPSADPTTIPAAPTVLPANAISLWGTTLGHYPGSNANPGWGQATAMSTIVVAGDDVMKLANLDFQGFEIDPSYTTSLDVTGMASLHVDLYTPSMTVVSVSLISSGLENAVALTPTTAGWNSFDIPLTSYTVPNLAAIIQVKFEDVARTGSTVYVDNLYFSTVAPVVANQDPTTIPAAPTVLAANAISLWGTTLGHYPGSNANPGWGQATAMSTIVVAGDDVMKLANLDFQGFEIDPTYTTSLDVTGMTNLHVDLFTPSMTVVSVSLVSTGLENAVALTPTTAGWNSFDIPLTSYTVPNLAAIIQVKFEDVPRTGSTVYVDNLYFW